ncbi:MAG: hypothetical protein KAG89_20310 [Fulvimarina manganoxydans]|uniref:hypothetical protein n=1 Tax=Fulvimarina manganoxydans TaxID=937218 RepID=UPI002353415C|nr:hypothetical protein [Fulvimarina manganoxydans]MCK5934503.1 hypothetical protein [Fulvimarina manganoxydans]
MKPPVILPDEGQLSEAEFMALGAKIAARSGAAPSSSEGGRQPRASAQTSSASRIEAAKEPPAPPPKIDAQLDEDEPLARLRLVTPVTIDGTRHVWLEFREPTFASIGLVLSGRISEPALAALVTGLPDGFLRHLRYTDAERVMSFVHALVPDLPKG